MLWVLGSDPQNIYIIEELQLWRTRNRVANADVNGKRPKNPNMIKEQWLLDQASMMDSWAQCQVFGGMHVNKKQDPLGLLAENV